MTLPDIGSAVKKTNLKSAAQLKRKGNRFERKLAVMGVIFASPWILGFILFHAYPLIMSVYYSFTSYSILEAGEWVGLENYRILAHDDIFWKSIYNTLFFLLYSSFPSA